MSFLPKKEIFKAMKFVLPPVLWASVIFYFSSLPTVTASEFYLWDFLLKKTAHFVEYGILAILIYRALTNYEIKKDRAKWLSILIAFLYAITDEYHQSFVPGRGPSVRDVVIDTIGAVILLTAANKMLY
jgi:VanZ family protein